MNGLEFNKIAASVLLAGLIAIIISHITNFLYKPEYDSNVRGYKVEVAESTGAQEAPIEKKLSPQEIALLIAKGNVENGGILAQKCSLCHTMDKGGAAKLGPNLWNIVKNKKAHDSKFAYSPGLQQKGENWEYEDLYHFLKSPKTYIPGTKMSFAGFRKDQDLADIIMYLRSLSDNPEPLPQ